jgi:hypothetical protein
MIGSGFLAPPKPIRRPPADVRIFGILFILSGLMDLYIIVANPNYSLRFFGMVLPGIWGRLFILASPTVHLIAGFGCLRLRSWTYPLLMTYSLYGMANALTNLYWVGYGDIRMTFIVGTAAFIVYLYLRRNAFRPAT